MKAIPPPLTAGDTIAVIAPAGNIQDRQRYRDGCSILRDMGFTLRDLEKEWPGSGFLSDSDHLRAREFMSAWCSPDVKAVFTLRGGYGSLRIVDLLDMNMISKHPKFIIGFSDITILLNHIAHHTGIICLHGPVISSLASCDKKSIERLYHCLTGNWDVQLSEKIEIIRAAPVASGTLMGGNLSSLVTLQGTGLDVDYRDSILVLEDVNEPLYRIDRLLTQFSLGGKFSGVKGIILGDFADSTNLDRNEQDRIHEFVWQRVNELVPNPATPIWGRFPIGHNRKNITIPIGARCTMDSSRALLCFQRGRHGN